MKRQLVRITTKELRDTEVRVLVTGDDLFAVTRDRRVYVTGEVLALDCFAVYHVPTGARVYWGLGSQREARRLALALSADDEGVWREFTGPRELTEKQYLKIRELRERHLTENTALGPGEESTP